VAGWKLRIEERAEAEARSAFLWYLRRNPLAGDRFQAAVFHSGTGFTSVDVSAHIIHLDGTAERVWETLSGMYQMLCLPPDAVARLRRDFLGDAAAVTDAAGRVPCTMRFLLLSATRCSP
jgi:hypothetical protein